MKNSLTYIMVVVVFAFIISGCGHSGGQVGVAGSVEEVPISSATDSNGVTLEGAIIDPTKAVIVNVDSAVSSLIAYLECDGEAVGLDVIPISATQFNLLPTAGRYPQKTDCELRVAAVGSGAALNTASSVSADSVNLTKADATFTIIHYSVGCDYIDLFDNDKTIDITAAAGEDGSGCFKYFGTDSAAGVFEMVSGFLHVGNLSGAGVRNEAFYKRISGSDYEIELALDDLAYEFNMGDDFESLIVGIFIGEDITKFNIENPTSPGAIVAYQAGWDEGMRFQCMAGSTVADAMTEINDCGDGSSPPYIGLINKDSKIAPYYSFDQGQTKKFFSLVGVGGTSFDLSEAFSGLTDLDVGILVFTENIGVFGEIFIDSILIDGDAGFVE